jgi:hypothetical protein
MGTPDGRGHRIQAAVVFPCRVPHQRSVVEPEEGNSVAEAFDCRGRRGLNGGAERPEVSPRRRRQGRKVGPHLSALPDGIALRRRDSCHGHPTSAFPATISVTPPNGLRISCTISSWRRTNLRSLEHSRRAAPARRTARLRPVGCMRRLGCAAQRAFPWNVIAQCCSRRTESAGLGRWTSRRKQGSTAPSAKMPTTEAVSRPEFSTPIHVAAGM